MGNICSLTGRTTEAVSYYKKSFEINESFSDAYFNIATIYHSEGMLDEGEKYYNLAHEINPSMAEVHYNLGLLKYFKRDYFEALNHNMLAYKINPAYENALHNFKAIKNIKLLQQDEDFNERVPFNTKVIVTFTGIIIFLIIAYIVRILNPMSMNTAVEYRHIPENLRLLAKLKRENLDEFRHQVVQALKQVASDANTDVFMDILDSFKKEIIYESYFYIDFINEAILKIYEQDKVNIIFILDQLIFIAKIGDINTLELMDRILGETSKKEKYYNMLYKAYYELERRIVALESKIVGVKLKPVEKRFKVWLD